MISLFLLGGFRAERGSELVPEAAWGRRGPRSLVKLLALEQAHRLHREQIEEALWPNLGGTANNAFRKALHFARHCLEPDLGPRGASAYVTVNQDVVLLSPDLVQLDIDRFRAVARAALESEEPRALENAIALYGGELLPEDGYEEWTLGPREALAQLHLSLVLQLTGSLEKRGQFAPAASRLREALLASPADEEMHRTLMRLYAMGGRRHQALRQYQFCVKSLASELDAEPDPATEALHAAILMGRTTESVESPEIGRNDRRVPLPASIQWLPDGPLVAWAPTLGDLDGLLGDAAMGHGSMVLIAGEAGVGKSRLAAEAAHAAHASGATVLWGAAYEQEGQLPYGPFVEALDGAIRSGLVDIAGWPGSLVELAKLLPGLDPAHASVDGATDPDTWRATLYAAVGNVLDELGAGGTLLLILDDLHVADMATLRLLNHLGRLAAKRRWVIAGVYRAGEVSRGGELQRMGIGTSWCHRIDLTSLSRRDSDQLALALLDGGIADPDLLEEVYVQTLGNPLYVQELVLALREQGEIHRDQGIWKVRRRAATPVSRHIREIARSRIDALGEDVRSALSVVSVAGASCDFGLLRDACDLEERRLVDALDRALDAFVLDEHGDRIAFRHPLIRAAIYEELSSPRRHLLHAEIARVIERRSGSPTEARAGDVEDLAFHWTAAAEPDLAIPWLLLAAEQAIGIYAHDEAIDRLRQALTLIEDTASAVFERALRRAEILERIGDLQALLGNTSVAREAYRSALATVELGAKAIARLERKTAHEALMLGDLNDAETSIAHARLQLEDGLPVGAGTLEMARLQVVNAQVHFIAFRFAEALEAAEQGIGLAEAAGSDEDLAQGLEMAAMACLPLGQWQRGLDYERRRSGFSDVNRVVRDASDVHLCLADYHVYRSDSAEAARQLLETLKEAERIGAPRAVGLCHYYLGTMAYFPGKFSTALRRLTTAIAKYEQVGSESGEAMCRLVRGVAMTALGQLDEGRRELEMGLKAAEHGTLSSHGMIRLYAGLGRNRIDANDAMGALAYADAGLSLAQEPSTCICYASFHPVATVAYALTGDLPRAADLGVTALTHARDFDGPAYLCMALQANAIVHALNGEWSPAFVSLDEANDLAENHGFPYERCRTLLVRSFVHMRRRRPRDLAAATRFTAEASPILIRLGVRASLAQTRSSLGFLHDHLD